MRILIFLLLLPFAYAEIGNMENVIVQTPNGPQEIVATIDTGADSSSIDAELAVDWGLKILDETLTIIDTRGKEERQVVELHFTLGDKEIYTKGTISDRSGLSTKMLIGKKDLAGFLIDPAESHLTSPILPGDRSRIEVVFNNILDIYFIRIIILIPILSSLIVLLRHVVGVQTYGIFGPIIIAIDLMNVGIFSGILLYSVLIAIGLIFKWAMHRIRLPLISEISLLMFVLSGTIVGLTTLMNLNSMGLNKVLFPLIITAFMIERFSMTLMSHDVGEALIMLAMTFISSLFFAVIGSLILALDTFWLIAIFGISMVLTVAVSQYIGLRLTEIFRFKMVGR